MTPAKQSRHLKRLAAIHERKANEASASQEPWSLRNLRLYQNMMAKALSSRSKLISSYLARRAARKPATITLPRKVDRFDYSRAPICITGDNFTITPAHYAKNKYVISTKGVDGYKSRACRVAGAITNDAWVGRSKGYTASAAQAEKFYKLYTAGWDACFLSRKLEAPRV